MPVSALHTKSAPRRATRSIPLPIVESGRPLNRWLYPSLVLASFLLGVLISYMAWGRPSESISADLNPISVSSAAGSESDKMDFAALMEQVNPLEGYRLPVRYGDLGPRLLESGVINYDAFTAVYENAGDPLTQPQIEILKRGSNEPIVITPENAHFLLNFFWAVGLVNQNPILTEGPITQYSNGQIDRFASTGGWTLGTKPVKELFASTDLISLTSEQQARVEEVASSVYRPCCNNPTIFPDCNHGMAMLGLLELLASQGANVEGMFTAAKYVNAYWFPQQALMTAVYLKANQNVDFAQAAPRLVTGKDFFSASGAGQVYASLQSSGLLPQTPGNGGSCGS